MPLPPTSPEAAPFRPLPFLPRAIDLQKREDGSLILRCPVPLAPCARHIPELLHRNAQARPDHPWLVQRRGPDRQWTAVTYGQALRQVHAVTQYLLDLRREGEPVVVLSANSLEHGLLEVAAMQARMPYAPITTAYSLLSEDHERLRAMIGLLKPAVVFVQDGLQYERALAAVRDTVRDVHIVCVSNPPHLPDVATWPLIAATPVTDDVQASIERIGPQTVAKYQFTSGSTGLPKAVIVTQRMLCSAAMMAAQMVEWPEGEMPETVVLDWLPWSHVAGGHGVFNAVLMEGGTLYIDDGRPTPAEFGETLRNLREISPVRFSGMPVAYAMLAEALEQDEALGRSFFRNLRRMTYSGSRLPDTVHAALRAQAVRHTGYRIPFVSAYGSTETSAAVTYVYWPSERTGLIGLPHPGVAMKLVPLDDGVRYEVRVKSEAVTPGYLDQPELTAASFDEEGYFLMGDAASFVDPHDPLEGLAFAGRVAEEFKLQSGVFVRVGSLRVECINATSPLLRDLVITGEDQPWVGALAWLNISACQERFGLPDASFSELITCAALREALVKGLREHNRKNPGSSMRVRRLWLLEAPASMESGETNDKGYINQRKVLDARRAEVDALYAGTAAPNLIEID